MIRCGGITSARNNRRPAACVKKRGVQFESREIPGIRRPRGHRLHHPIARPRGWAVPPWATASR